MARSRGKTPTKPPTARQPAKSTEPTEELSEEDLEELEQIDDSIIIEEALVDPDRLAPIPDRDPRKERELRKAVREAKRTPEQSRAALRRKTRIFYDLQRLRIQTAGRTYKRATDIELHELDLAVLDMRANDLLRAERAALSDIRVHLSTMPAFNNILADKKRFRGIGPTLAAVILSEVDITRCNTPSALWRFSGLSVVPCRRCIVCFDPVVPSKESSGLFAHEFNRKEKCALGALVSHEQTRESAKAERGVKGQKLPYNRFLKTKMVGVMAGCLLKSESPFKAFYDNYKHRLVSQKWGRNDGHRHQASMRYMTKQVLLTIWIAWRTLEGLDVRAPYAEEYLGKRHHG